MCAGRRQADRRQMHDHNSFVFEQRARARHQSLLDEAARERAATINDEQPRMVPRSAILGVRIVHALRRLTLVAIGRLPMSGLARSGALALGGPYANLGARTEAKFVEDV